MSSAQQHRTTTTVSSKEFLPQKAGCLTLHKRHLDSHAMIMLKEQGPWYAFTFTLIAVNDRNAE